jgi:hypothetical protein
MIRYRDLTEEQKKIVCNGCGPKGGWVPVPDFFCKASCDHHDFRYWKGGSEADREAADHDFLVMMLEDAGSNPAKQTIAITYWMAVRLFGAFCFHYADRERDENDLAEALAVIRLAGGPMPNCC